MTEGFKTDVLVSGTGPFAGRIALDIAATAERPISVAIAGRNRDRLDWLRTAGNARAAMFGRPATFSTLEADLTEDGAAERVIAQTRPRIAVQAASVQTSMVISDTGNAWTALVAEGGLSATAPFHAVITGKVARAIAEHSPETAFINCCFPDVVNGLIAAQGYNVLCGTGNVAILSNVFSGAKGISDPARLRVLAHYQNLAAWRRPSGERQGAVAPRVFLDGREIADVFEDFADVKLTAEPAIEVSGASGVTLIRAYVAGEPWVGHVPGPNGLPGGYPVRLEEGTLRLNLPDGLTQEEAVSWNAAFEATNGLVVEGREARYTGALKAVLKRWDFPHADGFALEELDTVHRDLSALRNRLSAIPA
ncbi:hypothetical protein HW532_18805 [Kaustia mangrovi]|uniref:Saccharopine dehydrogenase NADP binding domain-containing protein n=1 Tax=Kaustia mangrovi TaxID=2593653 RepID=A0A7S8C729_9HYPH|nr:hypothetical protein [Kaustia mangrovi]QPC44567.1 hypothetical protein HW532_18805 [Kaustia mangrovi]